MATTKNYWLVKSEPSAYSWDDLLKLGRDMWDGVRNFQARNNLNAMKTGDQVLFYHSVKNPGVVGVCEVVRAAYPDPTTDDARWVVVDVEPRFALKKTVPLKAIKADDELREMALVKQSRLSVMPVDKAHFAKIVTLGGRKKL